MPVAMRIFIQTTGDHQGVTVEEEEREITSPLGETGGKTFVKSTRRGLQ